jgi:hypothetical protein
VFVESSVIFHANVELLGRREERKLGADSVKKSLHKVIDEADIGGSGERSVNLVSWVLKGNSSSVSEYQSYRVPSWGVVSFASPLENSLGIFQKYAQDVVFGLGGDGKNPASVKVSRRRALGRGLASVIRKLNATKALAESMPHLPIIESVSTPFEEALDLIATAMNQNDLDVLAKLALVRKASSLANGISSDPSLIPQLFVSDENLFAVFAPMIVPTMFPLLIGFVQETKKKLTKKKTVIA